MSREIQRYATQLLVELLGPGETDKRFYWCRGDSRNPADVGRTLPLDAVWESRKLIVDVDERQHGEPVDFFDKPQRMTVSGVHEANSVGFTMSERSDSPKRMGTRSSGFRLLSSCGGAAGSRRINPPIWRPCAG